MRLEGIVKTWNDERGFGFIAPVKGGQEIFVHAKAFTPGLGRPAENSKVSFEVQQSADGKKRATNVQLLQSSRAPSRGNRELPKQWSKASIYALALFVLTYLVVTIVWHISLLVVLAYFVMSVICGLFYWHDKYAAQSGQWRTPEGTLLMLGLFGGWPGAIVAQQMLRHKTSKVSFRVVFWATVVLNFGAFILVTTPLMVMVKS